MTAAEFLLLAGGILLLAFFLLGRVTPLLGRRLETTAGRRSQDLREEFLQLSPRRILIALLASGGLLASVALLLFNKPGWAPAAGAVPVFLSGLAVRSYRKRRRRRIISQLPGFLDILAGHVKAGHSMREAVFGSLPLLPGGIHEEIAWLAQLCRLGTPLPQALLLWEERMPCEEISLVVRPLRAALPAGGNVVDLLARTRDALRSKIRADERMRSMTAQARLQAVVLTLLPPGFIAVLSRIDSSFLPRCLGSTLGKGILAASCLLQVLGWLVIRKILSARP